MQNSQNVIYKTRNDPIKKWTMDLNKQFPIEGILVACKFANKPQ